MSRALVLTYHAVEDGVGALFVDPGTFARQLDCIVESGAEPLTVAQLADRLRAGTLDRPAVAVTFDDGIASVARVAAPLLVERGLPATVFCVAGHVGGVSDWPSALPGSARLELADADELAALARAGFEIGAHGLMHAPLDSGDEELFRRELVEARDVLERVTRTRVLSLAYPYGAAPAAAAARIVERTYVAACTTVPGETRQGANLFALPRVDAHYLRRPELLRRALEGTLGPYLAARRIGSRARRALRKDYATA